MGKVTVKGASGNVNENGEFEPSEAKKITYESKVHGKEQQKEPKVKPVEIDIDL